MLFTVIISLFVIGLSFIIDMSISSIVKSMESNFGGNFVNKLHIFMNADDAVKT